MNANLTTIALLLALMGATCAQSAFDDFQFTTIVQVNGFPPLVGQSGNEAAPGVIGGFREITVTRNNAGVPEFELGGISNGGSFVVDAATGVTGSVLLDYSGAGGFGFPQENLRQFGCGCFNLGVVQNDVPITFNISIFPASAANTPLVHSLIIGDVDELTSFCLPYDQAPLTAYEEVVRLTALFTLDQTSDTQIVTFCCQPTVVCWHEVDEMGRPETTVGDDVRFTICCLNYESEPATTEGYSGTFEIPAFMGPPMMITCDNVNANMMMVGATTVSFAGSNLGDEDMFSCSFISTAIAGGSVTDIAGEYSINGAVGTIPTNADAPLDSTNGALCDPTNTNTSALTVQQAPTTLPPTTLPPTTLSPTTLPPTTLPPTTVPPTTLPPTTLPPTTRPPTTLPPTTLPPTTRPPTTLPPTTLPPTTAPPVVIPTTQPPTTLPPTTLPPTTVPPTTLPPTTLPPTTLPPTTLPPVVIPTTQPPTTLPPTTLPPITLPPTTLPPTTLPPTTAPPIVIPTTQPPTTLPPTTLPPTTAPPVAIPTTLPPTTLPPTTAPPTTLPPTTAPPTTRPPTTRPPTTLAPTEPICPDFNLEFGIPPGRFSYRLMDHPDAQEQPPSYCLRFDGLVGGNNVLTFTCTNVILTLDGTAGTVRINGNGFGGRDIGLTWLAPSVITFDITYSAIFLNNGIKTNDIGSGTLTFEGTTYNLNGFPVEPTLSIRRGVRGVNTQYGVEGWLQVSVPGFPPLPHFTDDWLAVVGECLTSVVNPVLPDPDRAFPADLADTCDLPAECDECSCNCFASPCMVQSVDTTATLSVPAGGCLVVSAGVSVGDIQGSGASECVRLESGASANTVDLRGGNDCFVAEKAVVNTVLGGRDDDCFTVSDETIINGDLNGGADDDTFFVDASLADQILGGSGDNCYDITSVAGRNIKGGSGQDRGFIWDTTLTGEVSLGGGDDNVFIYRSAVPGGIKGGPGNDDIITYHTNYALMKGSAGDDCLQSQQNTMGILQGNTGTDVCATDATGSPANSCETSIMI